MTEPDYGRTRIDDHARDGAGWVWRKVRLVLWIIGLLAIAFLVLLAAGLYKLAT
jgi:hypothetical protein